MIKFQCAKCNGKIGVEDSLAGRRIKCPRCAAVNSVPGEKTAANAPVRSSAPPPPPQAEPNALFENPLADAAQLEGPPVNLDALATPGRAALASASPKSAQAATKFGLVPAAAIAPVLLLVATAYFHRNDFSGQPEQFAYNAGVAAGELIGGFLIAIVVAYAAFRAADRSRKVATIGFCVIIAMAIGGAAMRSAAKDRKAEQLAASKHVDQLMRSLENAGLEQSERESAMAELQTAMEKMVEQADGDDKIRFAVRLDVARWMYEIDDAYVGPLRRVKATGAFDPKSIKTKEEAQARLAAIEQFEPASQAHIVAMRTIPDRVQHRIAETSLNERAQNDLFQSLGGSVQPVVINGNADSEEADIKALRRVYRLYIDNWASLSPGPDGALQFKDLSMQLKLIDCYSNATHK